MKILPSTKLDKLVDGSRHFAHVLMDDNNPDRQRDTLVIDGGVYGGNWTLTIEEYVSASGSTRNKLLVRCRGPIVVVPDGSYYY